MEELLHNLGIDWKLVLAQIANFAILLYVLKRFAYKPILKLMEDRKKKIEEGIRNAQEAEETLASADEKREEAISQGRAQALEIVDNAKREGESMRQTAVRAAEKEAETIVSDAREQITREREEAFRSVRQELGELVMLASKRLTREAITPEAHKELVNQALSDMDKHE